MKNSVLVRRMGVILTRGKALEVESVLLQSHCGQPGRASTRYTVQQIQWCLQGPFLEKEPTSYQSPAPLFLLLSAQSRAHLTGESNKIEMTNVAVISAFYISTWIQGLECGGYFFVFLCIEVVRFWVRDIYIFSRLQADFAFKRGG